MEEMREKRKSDADFLGATKWREMAESRRKADRNESGVSCLVAAPASGAHPASAGFSGQPYHHSVSTTPCLLPTILISCPSISMVSTQ